MGIEQCSENNAILHAMKRRRQQILFRGLLYPAT